MGDDRSVVVGDARFVISSGNDVPDKATDVERVPDILRVFLLHRFVGFYL